MKKLTRFISAILTVLMVLGSVVIVSAAGPAYDNYLTAANASEQAKLDKMTLERTQNGYELYCGTSSAEIVFTETPALDKLFRLDVRGESARYEGDVSAELMRKFGAKLLFVEEAAGVVNYYLYSEKLPRGVRLNGREVNLHIAVGEGRTAAGTPIIFGGF